MCSACLFIVIDTIMQKRTCSLDSLYYHVILMSSTRQWRPDYCSSSCSKLQTVLLYRRFILRDSRRRTVADFGCLACFVTSTHTPSTSSHMHVVQHTESLYYIDHVHTPIAIAI
ncbi:hypothetical protein CY34DRAFT_179118 [Suillus luteus UH-Slu-Lm8-n1]|uniref:Uncharacterized protein n=1 Tax=Suillus luteus UH-Slu-Lm8-n1 TaxID=930992 RepID=A0A0C9ZVP9_9AGAM|nr:hypothetical protein CY34DRAFT_179118 [Suillus luteus UH-Slu-Lm8-n1]